VVCLLVCLLFNGASALFRLLVPRTVEMKQINANITRRNDFRLAKEEMEDMYTGECSRCCAYCVLTRACEIHVRTLRTCRRLLTLRF